MTVSELFSAIVYDWILASSEYSIRTMRTHLYVKRTVLEMEHEVPMLLCIEEDFAIEFDWNISFLTSRVTSLDVW